MSVKRGAHCKNRDSIRGNPLRDELNSTKREEEYCADKNKLLQKRTHSLLKQLLYSHGSGELRPTLRYYQNLYPKVRRNWFLSSLSLVIGASLGVAPLSSPRCVLKA